MSATDWLARRFYPDYRSEDDLFRGEIERFLRPEDLVLDAGCGSGLFEHDYKTRTRLLVGCDVVPGISRHTRIHAAAMGDLTRLPFAGASFDLLFCRYVLEHAADPSGVFGEFSRVLKPGGTLVLLTPNLHHYVTLISRFTPHWFHHWVASWRGNCHEDVFPTVYKANTKRDLLRLLSGSGLDLVSYSAFEAKPNYLTMSPLTYAAGIAYERLVNRWASLSRFRVSIVLAARKAAQT